tara:strand:+ start:1779 stop:2486 length:708 start_codon:yes stop_codon:yes gene_type:complete
MGVIGALGDVATSLGRELFGFLIRSDPKIAELAGRSGVTMDTLEAAPPEALSAILERAARSGAIDPRDANNITIQLAKEAQPTMPKLKVDNPGGDWLQSKLRRALETREGARPNTYQSTLGSGEGVTGYFRGPLALNPNMLADIPGSLGEELFRPDPVKIDRLRRSIAEEGYDELSGTVLIQVREDGVPFVVEGNHRIIEGIESGRPTIPVEIKYLRGAEDVDGPLSPAALGVPR